MIDHNELRQLISMYFDGQATAAEAATVEEHLHTCADCQRYAKVLQKLSSSLKTWPDETLSPDLERKIKSNLIQVPKREDKHMNKYPLIGVGLGGSAIVVLIAAVLIAQIQSTKRLALTQGQPVSTIALTSEKKMSSSQISHEVRSTIAIKGDESAMLQATLPSMIEKTFEKTKAVATNASRRAGSTLAMMNGQDQGRIRDASQYQVAAAQYNPYYTNAQYAVSASVAGAPVGMKRVDYYPIQPLPQQENFNTEQYNRIEENEFLEAKDNPLSTFSIDVDTASYTNVRRYLTSGNMPPKDAVRIEEMINYFSYKYSQPQGEDPFSVTTEVSACPWNPNHKLAMIGLQGKKLQAKELPSSNLVFLIDVSGSMNSPDKLPLLQQSFNMMVKQLRKEDTVSIVVYAGAAGEVLPPTRGDQKETIQQAIDQLQAGGSTAGGAGIKLAYELAKKNYLSNGNNRVILATDGDFNVGVSSDGELTRLIEEKRQEGVFLTVLGFGTGNLKDSRMEQLADKGNGNYFYIDNINEGRKALVTELGSTLFAIAKDVKIQVEFNPAQVKAYHLVGYENRLLAKEDFNDDKKDAGELGTGHTVTALYEIIPADSNEDVGKSVDPLEYQSKEVKASDDVLTVKLRYKNPTEDKSQLITQKIKKSALTENTPSENLQFASSVAEFGLVLRDSKFRGNASYANVISRAGQAKGEDKEGYRAEFIDLVKKAQSLDTMRIAPDEMGVK